MTDTCYPSSLAGAELSELQRLLYERCESLDEVIVVLWLAAHRERAWSLEALSAELGIDEYALLMALKHLTDMGLVLRRGPGLACYRYDAELGGEVVRVFELHGAVVLAPDALEPRVDVGHAIVAVAMGERKAGPVLKPGLRF